MKVCKQEAASHDLIMSASGRRMPVEQRVYRLEAAVALKWRWNFFGGGVSSRYCVSGVLDRPLFP